jgi:hypothetical protein
VPEINTRPSAVERKNWTILGIEKMRKIVIVKNENSHGERD